MSTEIKSTLYRFVTMRAPQLLEAEDVIKSFVLHPESEMTTYTSVFLNAVTTIPSGSTRALVLKNTAVTYATANNVYKDKMLLKKAVGDEFYEYALWLTKNRNTLTITQVLEKTNEITAAKLTKFDAAEIKIWDNLFYQIVTSKSSYVREAILSLLVARFFIKKNINADDKLNYIRKLAQARVILPKLLFRPEDNSIAIAERKDNALKLPVTTKELQKTNDLLLIVNQKNELETIQKSLIAVEKKYNIVNNNSLQDYNSQYDIDVASAYAKATKVEKTYTDPVTNEVIIYFIYENLNLPVYNFKPKNQLEYCLKISKKDEVYTNLVNYCIDELLHTTFEEVKSYINEALSNLTTLLFQRTTTSKRIANVDGVVISSSENSNYARIQNGFTFLTLNSYPNKYIALSFTSMEVGTDIITGNCTITFQDGITINGDYQNQTLSSEWVNGKLVLKIFNYAEHYYSPTATAIGSLTITGTFTSSTGRELKIVGGGTTRETSTANYISSPDDIPVYPPTGSNLISSGFGKYTYEDLIVGSSGVGNSTDTGSGTSPSGTNNELTDDTISSSVTVLEHIPSGYGIKRLGIADYRKVEQEVCCYVPGEVSQIENIMAREYKEKSTRRLRRQEDTLTSTKEKETEKLSDTTSTERFEMNQEVSSVMAEDTHLGAQTSFGAHWGTGGGPKYDLMVGADFANNTSQEISDNQAVTNSKEITERVLERVVQKVKEERITKIIEEYEENNKHGYDNRKGDKHISGVYRWVDKIYRNQVINYGKRLMYEFMIPEPATFHNLAIEYKIDSNGVDIIEKPIDPRTAPTSIKLGLDVDFYTRYLYWAAILNVEIGSLPSEFISIGTEFNFDSLENSKTSRSWSGKKDLDIPDGYKTIEAIATFASAGFAGSSWGMSMGVSVGNLRFHSINSNLNYLLQAVPLTATAPDSLKSFEKSIPVSTFFVAHHVGIVNVSVKCQLTESARSQWQIETFNAIISAYEDRLKEYNDKMESLKGVQVEKVKSNPLFYRQIENTVLRKNCIEYMISHDVLGGTSLTEGNDLKLTHVLYDNINLETYAAKVKFFEQAFEWNLMSYNFYPFYWAPKDKWQDLYNVEEVDDPLFRSFLQSGMARVIVTVRPGFEEVVNWYMGTGQVWNGGQVPTMNDPLFISIIEELRQPEGAVEETWESRVPTSLTVIQAGTIGLNVQGLPCDDDCDEYKQFDSDGNQVFNPDGTPIILPNPIEQSLDSEGNPINLGNVVEDLETVTESIAEIKTDIEEIKTTLTTMAGGN